MKAPRGLEKHGRALWAQLQDEYAIVDAGGLALLTTACQWAAGHRTGVHGDSAKRRLLDHSRYGQRRPHPLLSVARDARAQKLSGAEVAASRRGTAEESAGTAGGEIGMGTKRTPRMRGRHAIELTPALEHFLMCGCTPNRFAPARLPGWFQAHLEIAPDAAALTAHWLAHRAGLDSRGQEERVRAGGGGLVRRRSAEG